jgi:hypothetical protein
VKLLILIGIILVALTVIFTVRAIRARRERNAIEGDYGVWQLDTYDHTQIRIARPGQVGRVEAVIEKDDPDYSNRVIEEFAKADAKAGDWNTTKRALT